MRLSEVYLGLGEQTLGDLLRVVSIGRLKSFQLYERLKVRFHLNKLNSETLRKSAPKFWQRFKDGDEELASELAQAILISHMDMIVAVLNYLGVPHSEGFFEKDLNASQYHGIPRPVPGEGRFVLPQPPGLGDGASADLPAGGDCGLVPPYPSWNNFSLPWKAVWSG
ncbi:MAG: hypothetical protein NTV70_19070 [Acidobacteria bacterium]|nr:hypothetical protein [Acidobacteriota bacterium]